MNRGRVSEAERAVGRAFPRGGVVDLTDAEDRTVRAEVIAALLLGDGSGEPGCVAAVRLAGARVTGTLALGHAQVSGPVQLRDCEFEAAIELPGARTRDVDLEGSRFPGLHATGAEIGGDLGLKNCQCAGQITLTGARVTGTLRMEEASVDHPGGTAILANRLVVGDDLIAPRATVNGEMRLAGAQVAGIVLLDGAVLRAAGARRALNAFNLNVGLNLLARSGFTASGEVALSQARVGQNLNLRGAAFHNPGGDALRCRGADAVRLGLAGVTVDGTADFRDSRFTIISDDPGSWPERLRLSGLSYQALEPPLSAARRVEWLRGDADGYLPRSYETLAAMYRGQGDDGAARTVLLAGERERRRLLPRYGRAWSLLQEITVGYGYRPVRAAGWLAAFLAAGTVVFGLHHPPPLAGAPHPAFNPFVYTLDLLVPLVNFGLRDTYDPQGAQRWLAYLLIAVGWIFATTIASGIARILQRQ